MKQSLFKIFTAIILMVASLASSYAMAYQQSSYTKTNPNNKIQWMTNFDEAAKIARQKSLPLVLFFTGSDWCMWCKKIEKEIFDTAEFARKANGKFIFVKLDFPRRTPLSPALKKQNEALKTRYNITGFPTLVILSSEKTYIGKTNYLPIGPIKYADHLEKMVLDFQQSSL